MAMRMLPPIEVGYAVFLGDGADAFGAVRSVNRERILVNVENAGDLTIPLEAIAKVANKRVVVDWGKLADDVRRAIGHTGDVEDFPPPGEGEVEQVNALPDDEEDQDYAERWTGMRDVSPPGELPGRDLGSRLGAPPSITSPRRRSE